MCRTPAFSASSAIALASAKFKASGFSQRTCFPLRAAAMAIGGWKTFGVAIDDSVHLVAFHDVFPVRRGHRHAGLLPCGFQRRRMCIA